MTVFASAAPADLLRGRTILVTGCGAGIGRACAHAFAAHGARVIALSRSAEKLASLHDEVEACHPGCLTVQAMDFLSCGAAEYRRLADALDERAECLDGLLHCAAVLGPRTPVEHYPATAWTTVMQTNLSAAFLLTQALLPALQRAPDARLLFTSSGVGRAGRGGYWGAYAVSKFAVEGLMQVLADELGNTGTVRVNSLNPGPTRTAMRAAAFPAENPQALPAPEALMPVYLYLMSPAARHLHGQALDARNLAAHLPSQPSPAPGKATT